MEKDLNRILSDQKSKTKLSLLICVSLAVASAFLLPSGQAIGWAFLVMAVITGAALAIRIRRGRTELAKLGMAGMTPGFLTKESLKEMRKEIASFGERVPGD